MSVLTPATLAAILGAAIPVDAIDRLLDHIDTLEPTHTTRAVTVLHVEELDADGRQVAGPYWYVRGPLRRTQQRAVTDARMLTTANETIQGEEVDRDEVDAKPLNPGIRRLVCALNAAGFRTCDSGDGETHDYECDRGYPYVVIRVDNPDILVSEAVRLRSLVATWGIITEAICGEECEHPHISLSWCPDEGSGGFVELVNVTDTMLPAGMGDTVTVCELGNCSHTPEVER